MSLKKTSFVVTSIPKLAISTSDNNVKGIGDHGQFSWGRSKQAKGLAYSPWPKCKNDTKNQTRNQEHGGNLPSCIMKKHIWLN
jgi:hypothetical protein